MTNNDLTRGEKIYRQSGKPYPYFQLWQAKDEFIVFDSIGELPGLYKLRELTTLCILESNNI